jgi:hypothetical protein
MLVLATFILASSIMILLIRESRSETYRCPHCAQIQVGSYHRFRCPVLNRQAKKVPLPGETQPAGYPQAGSREALAMRD